MRVPKILIALVASLLAGCLSSACLAQIEVDAKSATAIKGLKSPEVIGSAVVVDAESKPEYLPVGVLTVSVPSGEVTVTAEDIERRPVEVVEAAGKYLILKPGKFWVEVKQYDEFETGGRKIRFQVDEKTVVIEVGEVEPPEPPTPPLPPDGPFDGLAAKVKKAAKSLSVEKRQQYARAFEIGVSQLKNSPIQTTAVWDLIQSNAPPCSNGDCIPLQTLLNADAKTRRLGRQPLIEYYSEIAKGLK